VSDALRTERVKRERFMPFRFARTGLKLELLQAQIDDETPLLQDAEDRDQSELHLEDDRWQRLRLRLQLSRDPELLSQLLPPQELQRPAVRLLLVVSEPRARLRRALPLPFEPTTEAVTVEVRLEHHELAGPCAITPWLVRSEPGRAVSGFAHAAGHRLASGRALSVVPYAPATRAGQFLDVQYRSFRQDPQLRSQPYRLHYLELSGDQPLLLINSDHRSIADALDARGQSGTRARLREVFYDMMSVSVWSQLFMHAAEALSEDGTTRHSWQDGVLAELLPQVFPNLKRHHERLRELIEIRDSDHALGQLSALCDQALQQRLDLVKHMERLVQDTVGVGRG